MTRICHGPNATGENSSDSFVALTRDHPFVFSGARLLSPAHLLLDSRGFDHGKPGIGVRSFGINDEPAAVSKGNLNQMEGIL